ncbi:MAG: 1,2-phenylacetyl-CoA epoxidase subunit B [Acidimicrobiia bacterium]|nr:1,2-phenylacetyl-CoA epoxidase subunit B [Acidimicrobiia bacterium]
MGARSGDRLRSQTGVTPCRGTGVTYEIPEVEGEERVDAVGDAKGAWPLWEVFVRAKRGLNHVHVGSVHAADPETAVQNARDTYTRRSEGVSIWVVPSATVHASDDSEAMFEPFEDKPYRHPTFYEIPDEVGQL